MGVVSRKTGTMKHSKSIKVIELLIYNFTQDKFWSGFKFVSDLQCTFKGTHNSKQQSKHRGEKKNQSYKYKLENS